MCPRNQKQPQQEKLFRTSGFQIGIEIKNLGFKKYFRGSSYHRQSLVRRGFGGRRRHPSSNNHCLLCAAQ